MRPLAVPDGGTALLQEAEEALILATDVETQEPLYCSLDYGGRPDLHLLARPGARVSKSCWNKR